MKLIASMGVVSLLGLFLAGCASQHEEGVRSDLHAQWVVVAADTKTTTDAAQAVLHSQGLKEVTASSTNVDGKATAKEADGTMVTVMISKENNGSKAVVTVGTMGDPALGADIAKRIKNKAEGM